jgi:6-carboxyhexanoate--CoA ligase
MRASLKDKHISGAEKIISESDISTCVDSLLTRAINHSKGKPDFINLKIEKVDENDIIKLEPLKVSYINVKTAQEGLQKIAELLERINIKNVDKIMQFLKESYPLRGAILLNVDTLERLEPDQQRGVRATYMDSIVNNFLETSKNHFREALVLATKVANTPNIVGEICISDDPDYVVGYVASKELGYVRITKTKDLGSELGGRIFLYRGDKKGVSRTIEYLEKQCILVNIRDDDEVGA